MIRLLLLLIVTWALAGGRLFVVHPGDRPIHADAVVVLAGYRCAR